MTSIIDKEAIIVEDKDDDCVDYTVDDSIRDCELICKDDTKLYYSSYLLAINFKVLRNSFSSKTDKTIVFKDFNSDVIIKVLRWIDKYDSDYKTPNDITDRSKVQQQISLAEEMYKFSNRYNCQALTTQLENFLVNYNKLSTLSILHDHKSKQYDSALKTFLDSKSYINDNTELEFVHRYIFNDILKIYQEIPKTVVDDSSAKLGYVKMYFNAVLLQTDLELTPSVIRLHLNHIITKCN